MRYQPGDANMRQGPNNKRPRGRGGNNNHNGGGGGGNNGGGNNRRPNMPNRNQTFDSNGPDVRIRGSAYQVHEKYLTLAQDATAAGDRIMAENYYQHAEHYYRIINAQEYGPDGQRRPRENLNNGQGYSQQVQGDEPQPDLGGGNQNGSQGENQESNAPQGSNNEFNDGSENGDDDFEENENGQPLHER